MALIKCPECGKEISDKAVACPNCGFPLDQLEKDNSIEKEDDGKLYKVILKNVPTDAKVKAIKIIRDIHSNFGLAEAKKFVETIPNTVTTGLIYSDAIKLQKEFTDIGITVEVEVDEKVESKVDVFSEMQSNERERQEKYAREAAIEDSKPKCPTCGSTNIQKISGTKRWLTTGLFGLASSNVGKTMECKNCGYKW